MKTKKKKPMERCEHCRKPLVNGKVLTNAGTLCSRCAQLIREA